MRKLFNKPWFVGLLALAAIGFVAYSLLAGRAPTSVAPVAVVEETAPDPSAPEAAPAGVRLSIRDALKEITTSSPIRDPFLSRIVVAEATVGVEKVVEPDLTDTVTVSAVWIQNGTTYALVNGRMYRVGDHIGRLTLESANRDGIWFRHWKGRDFVAIGGAFTLTTPARQAVNLSLSSES